MPLRPVAKSVCVFYALLISASTASQAAAQGYYESPPRSTHGVAGIVDQLSRGESPQVATRQGDNRQVVRSADYSAEYPNAMRAPAVDGGSGFYAREARPAGGESVVALRPQPMSVRQANFETEKPAAALYSDEETQSRSRQELGRMNAEQHYQSFIDREKTEPEAAAKAEPSQLITKIGVNLVFVLALGIGAILIFRQVLRGKGVAKGQTPTDLAGLKIDQVLQVTRGVSLYLVDSMASKILVAVDAGGIKSVNVLPSRFEDELEDPEAFSSGRDSVSRGAGGERSRAASRRSLNKTSSADIDENLIKLLLTKSKEAA